MLIRGKRNKIAAVTLLPHNLYTEYMRVDDRQICNWYRPYVKVSSATGHVTTSVSQKVSIRITQQALKLYNVGYMVSQRILSWNGW